MGSDQSRPDLRGLAYHDPRLTKVWGAESSYTQAGNTAGDPNPQQDTEMELEASGQQDADSTLRIQSLRGGLPGPGPMRAGFCWRDDDASDWRGWEVPTTPLGWEHVAWTDGTSGLVRGTYTPHSVTLDDGTVLVAVQAVYVSGSTSYQVRVYKRDPSDGSWSSTAIYSQDSTWTDGAYPCLVVLPSGRVLCYHWIEDTSENEAQVRCHYTDDEGDTWTQARSYVLETPVSTVSSPGAGNNGHELGRLRAAASNGQVVLVASLLANDTDPTYRADFRQWASFDEGMSFEVVDEGWTMASNGGAFHELLAVGGSFLLVYLSVVDLLPYVRSIGHASESYDDVAGVSLDSGSEVWGSYDGSAQYIDDGDLAVCLDEDGALYAYGRQPSVQNEGIVVRSIDGGATWEGMGHSPTTSGLSMWWNTQDSSTHPRAITATCQRGRVLVLHNWDANPGNEDNSLGCLYLGGYTSVTMPGWKAHPTDLDRVAFVWSWLPFDLPTDCGWTGAGAGTGVLASGALNISTTSNLRTYTRSPLGSIAEGLIVRAALDTASGGSLSNDDIALRLRLADSTDDYDVSVRFAATGIRVYDNNAGNPVGSETIDTTAGVEVLVAMSGSSIQVWYRARNTDEDHLWVEGPGANNLTSDIATPAANHLVSFGHGIGSTAESNWYEVHYCNDEWTGLVSELSDDWSNPESLAPRNYSVSPVYVDANVRVSAKDGPTVEEDVWNIDTAYEFGIANLLKPDPRKTWRATDDGTLCTIALALDETLLASEESQPANDVIALGLWGANFGVCTLKGFDVATASWVSLGILGLSYGMGGLHWTRRGNTVIPTGTNGTSNPYLFFNEFSGGSFRPDTAAKVRRIGWHTEGRFGPGTVKQPTLTLTGVDGTEGASGTSGEIWAPDAMLLVKLNGARFAGYRLEIPAQDTVDGFFEAGRLLLGPVAFFGTDYSWGRATETQANTALSETADRYRRAKVRSAPARTVEFAWVDGLDLTDIYEDDEPDYIYASTNPSAEPVASVADGPQVMEGLLRLLSGPGSQVVYLPRVPKAGGSVTLVRREESVLGRITSPVRVEVVQGDELEDEVVRVASVVIEEETPRDWGNN